MPEISSYDEFFRHFAFSDFSYEVKKKESMKRKKKKEKKGKREGERVWERDLGCFPMVEAKSSR
jgi:hypothetical protein